MFRNSLIWEYRCCYLGLHASLPMTLHRPSHKNMHQRMSNTPHVQFLRRGLTCWALTGTWGEIVPCHLKPERKSADSDPLLKALK